MRQRRLCTWEAEKRAIPPKERIRSDEGRTREVEQSVEGGFAETRVSDTLFRACVYAPVWRWLVYVYSGHSLVEAMPSQQRPLSPPDMFNPLVRQPFLSLVPLPLSPSIHLSLSLSSLLFVSWIHMDTSARTEKRTHVDRGERIRTVTLSFAPWGRPLSNRKPQRATALIKRAIDRHYR